MKTQHDRLKLHTVKLEENILIQKMSEPSVQKFKEENESLKTQVGGLKAQLETEMKKFNDYKAHVRALVSGLEE